MRRRKLGNCGPAGHGGHGREQQLLADEEDGRQWDGRGHDRLGERRGAGKGAGEESAGGKTKQKAAAAEEMMMMMIMMIMKITTVMDIGRH